MVTAIVAVPTALMVVAIMTSDTSPGRSGTEVVSYYAHHCCWRTLFNSNGEQLTVFEVTAPAAMLGTIDVLCKVAGVAAYG